MLQYIVKQLYFPWSNLIDGLQPPQALSRSEEPPGSYIWKASVYLKNANAAHLKGYKLQWTHNVSVLECSVGGLRPHLCQVWPSPQPVRPHTHKHVNVEVYKEIKSEGRQRGFSHTKKPVYLFHSVIYKGFNGGHLHKVCRRLICSMCQMRAALRRAT